MVEMERHLQLQELLFITAVVVGAVVAAAWELEMPDMAGAVWVVLVEHPHGGNYQAQGLKSFEEAGGEPSMQEKYKKNRVGEEV